MKFKKKIIKVTTREERDKERLRHGKYRVLKYSLGYRGEMEALKILGVERKAFLEDGCDIIWGGKKVDVKTGNIKDNAWTFHLGHQKGNVDYFFCICKIDDLTKYRILIPDRDIPIKTLYINKKNIDNYSNYFI